MWGRARDDAIVRLSLALTPTTDHPDPRGCWANVASKAAEI